FLNRCRKLSVRKRSSYISACLGVQCAIWRLPSFVMQGERAIGGTVIGSLLDHEDPHKLPSGADDFFYSRRVFFCFSPFERGVVNVEVYSAQVAESLYARRVAGGDRHHRHLDRALAPRGAEGP